MVYYKFKHFPKIQLKVVVLFCLPELSIVNLGYQKKYDVIKVFVFIIFKLKKICWNFYIELNQTFVMQMIQINKNSINSVKLIFKAVYKINKA